MQRSPKATEPSMEEILASIRKIIAEDPSGTAAAHPAPPAVPGAPPAPAHPSKAVPPAPGQGGAPYPGVDRRKTAELEADLADILGSIPARGPASSPATPPAQTPLARTNGMATPRPPGSPQSHRPLTEALNRARAAERDAKPPDQAAPPAPPAPPMVRAAPPPPSPAAAEAAPPRAAPPAPLILESKRAEPASETPPPVSSARAAEPEVPKPAPPPAAPADAVSAAAAAVARKVAATTSASPVPTRPSFMASRAAASSGEGGRTLEDTVAEMLRPMLKQWLETNMPRIVEKALKGEIADAASAANSGKGPASGSEQS